MSSFIVAESRVVPAQSLGSTSSSLGLCSNQEEDLEINDEVFVRLQREHACGWGWCGFKPRWLQWLNTPIPFLILLMMFILLQGMSINSFVSLSLPSLEKQFSFSSKQTGLIAASNEISAIIFVPFISFYGGFRHKARWIGFGALITALGLLLYSVPYFVGDSYRPTGDISRSPSYCLSSNKTQQDVSIECQKSGTPSEVSLFIFVLSQLVAGAGTTPLYTLGPAYVDENVNPKNTALYLGVIYGSVMLGPGLGAMIGGKLLGLYVDLKQPTGVALSTRDPRWVGAWWLGPLSAGCILFLVGSMLLGYPRQLNPSGRTMREEAIKDGILLKPNAKLKGNLKDIVPALKSLFTNPVFMFQNAGVTISSIVGLGIGPFVFKILRNRYGATPFITGVAVAVLLIPGAGGGMALGSFLVKKLRLKSSCKDAAKYAFLLQLLGAFVVLVFLTPGCTNNRIVGIHEPYDNSTMSERTGSLQSSCNANCGCRQSKYNPVCGPGGVVFYSPCYAGCRSKITGQGFGNCSCVLPRGFDLATPGDFKETFVKKGQCDRNCKNLEIFVALSTLVIMLSMSNAVPSKIVTLRCVAENQRPFALGLQFVLMRTLGSLPGPIMFGHVIDSTCQVWRMKCGLRLSCADYDNDRIGLYLVLIGTPLQCLATCFYFLSWRFCKRSDRHVVEPTPSITDKNDTGDREKAIAVNLTFISEDTVRQDNGVDKISVVSKHKDQSSFGTQIAVT